MRAPISIVIPTLNAEQRLPLCLASLSEGLEAGLIRELIVSDGGSQDNTQDIADAAGALWVQGEASRGGQLRAGCSKAEGDWILVLHADTQLAAGWSDTVMQAVSNEGAYYFRLAFDDHSLPARWVAGWANIRSRVLGLPYGDQGLLLTKSLYHRTGGYPDIPLMEDVAIAKALRGKLKALDSAAVTSADKFRQQGWARRGLRNLWTLSRYLLGVSPNRLASDYRR